MTTTTAEFPRTRYDGSRARPGFAVTKSIGLIASPRLELMSATPELVLAALAGAGELGALLDAQVPQTWPHEYLNTAAFEFFLGRLRQDQRQAGWWLRFVVLSAADGTRTLIGSAGYKGPPTPDGTLEIGYGIVSDQRRRGYATEVAQALVEQAFALRAVRRVIARTLPELAASIGVLERCGFRLIGGDSRAGPLRFELSREEHRALRGRSE